MDYLETMPKDELPEAQPEFIWDKPVAGPTAEVIEDEEDFEDEEYWVEDEDGEFEADADDELDEDLDDDDDDFPDHAIYK